MRFFLILAACLPLYAICYCKLMYNSYKQYKRKYVSYQNSIRKIDNSNKQYTVKSQGTKSFH